MKQEEDILSRKELKDIRYDIPEGYFEDFKANALRYAREAAYKEEKPRLRLAPYFAFAATLLIMFTVGSLVLKNSTSKEDFDDITAYFDIIPTTDKDAIFYSYNIQDDELSDEDIINYLISSGASAETIQELTEE